MPAQKKRIQAKKRPRQELEQKMEVSNVGYKIYGNVKNSPLPSSFKCSMIYATNFALNVATGGVPAVRVFSANGLYDPDITGVGHQPRGFDQLMALYDHYTVIGSKIEVMGSADQATNPMVFGIALMDGPSVSTDADDYLEEPYSSWQLANPNGPAVQVLQKFNNKFLGYKNPMSVEELEGTSSANPSEQAYYHVFAYSTSATDEGNVYLPVRITYTAILKEPDLPPQS